MLLFFKNGDGARSKWIPAFAGMTAVQGALLLTRFSGSKFRRWRREHFAVAVVLLGADDALLFHQFDQARGAVVPDLQPPLHAGYRGSTRFGHDAHGLVVQF